MTHIYLVLIPLCLLSKVKIFECIWWKRVVKGNVLLWKRFSYIIPHTRNTLIMMQTFVSKHIIRAQILHDPSERRVSKDSFEYLFSLCLCYLRWLVWGVILQPDFVLNMRVMLEYYNVEGLCLFLFMCGGVGKSFLVIYRVISMRDTL